MSGVFERIIEFGQGVPTLWVVLGLSALPVTELRAGVAWGVARHAPTVLVVLVAACGASATMLLGLAGLRWSATRLVHVRWIGPVLVRAMNWSEQRRGIVDRYGPWALVLAAAIPVPPFGPWKSMALSVILGRSYCVSAGFIALGILVQCILVAALAIGGHHAYIAISD